MSNKSHKGRIVITFKNAQCDSVIILIKKLMKRKVFSMEKIYNISVIVIKDSKMVSKVSLRSLRCILFILVVSFLKKCTVHTYLINIRSFQTIHHMHILFLKQPKIIIPTNHCSVIICNIWLVNIIVCFHYKHFRKAWDIISNDQY